MMLHSCRFVVLDEADEMLDLGFLEDVERILSLTPSSRQTALFSATMPPEIRRLADQYLYDPVSVKVKTATLTVDTVEQFALEVKPRDKEEALIKVLRAERPEQAIPPLLEGSDVIGQAQTGSGKTAAFGLPMLQYVDPSDHEVQGLVLTPTRELCIQVT